MLAAPPASAARRRALALAAGAAALAYYAHRQRWLARSRAALAPLADAAAAYRDALNTSGQLASRLSADVAAFLAADGDAEVPASVRQLLRLAQCAEAQAAATSLGASLSRGLATGLASAASQAEPLAAGRQLLQQALDGVTSERGRSVIACVAGAAARHAVVAALEVADRQRAAAAASPAGVPDVDSLERVLSELDSDRGRRVASDVVSALVRGAVGAFLSESADVDVADSFVRTLSRPEHREAVGELAQRVTGEAVRALVSAGAAELAARAARNAQPAAGAPGDAARAVAASPSRAAAARARHTAAATPPRGSAAQAARCGPVRRVFSLPSPPHGLGSPPDGAEPQPLSTPPPCTLCAEGGELLCGHHAPPRWMSAASANGASCGANGSRAVSPDDVFASGAQQQPLHAQPAAQPDASWVATARLALSLASQPEARALLRDVAGAAAGASVRALVTAVPSALCSMLPPLPFRRRAAAAPPPPPPRPVRRAARAPPPPASPSARLVELDDNGQPLEGAADDAAGAQAGYALSVAPLWRSLDTARVQGALAVALVVHALAFMPGAAARAGLAYTMG